MAAGKAMAAMLLATTMLGASAIFASPAMAQETRSFDVPAGSLADALNRFARQAGVELAYPAQITQGKSNTALRGSYDVTEGLSRLLTGTGVTYRQTGPKAFTLDRGPVVNSETIQLGPVRVEGESGNFASDGIKRSPSRDPAATEGTGSYTSFLTSVASKDTQTFREVPQSVSVVTRQEIEDQSLLNINDALARLPGLTYDGTSYYSRGFGVTSLQIDGGAPLAIGDYVYQDLQQDLAFYDRVEIMRGASGLLGGVGDPGGIINLVRKKPLSKRQFTLNLMAGRWDTYRADVDVTGPITSDGRLRGRAIAVYQTNDSFVDYRSSRKPSAYATLEADIGNNTILTVGGSYAEVNNDGAPPSLPRYSDGIDLKLPRNTNLSNPWAYDDTTAWEAFAQLEHHLANGWKVKVNLMHSDKEVDRIYNYTVGAVDTVTLTGPRYGAGRVRTTNKQNVVDINLGGAFDLFGRSHEFLIGFDYQKVKGTWRNQNLSTNYTVYVDVFDPQPWNPSMTEDDYNYRAAYDPWGQEQIGGYGVLRLHPTDRLHVIAGTRVSKYNFFQYIETKRGTADWTLSQDVNFKQSAKATPYGGIIYDFADQWSGYFSFSSIYKPQPLVMAGPAPGTSLPPIRGKSYEAGIKGQILDGRLNTTLSFFHVERTGTAVSDPRYEATSSAYDGSCCYVAQGKVTSQGFDVEIAGELLPGLQMLAGYTYNKTEDKSTEKVFSSITPKHTFKLSTAYTLPGALSGWKIGGEALVKSTHYNSGTAVVDGASVSYNFTQNGYALINGLIQYSFSDQLSASVNVQNIFDKTYYQALGSTSGNNVYGQPRNVMFTLRAKIN